MISTLDNNAQRSITSALRRPLPNPSEQQVARVPESHLVELNVCWKVLLKAARDAWKAQDETLAMDLYAQAAREAVKFFGAHSTHATPIMLEWMEACEAVYKRKKAAANS